MRGYTIVEMLVTIFIVGIIMISITNSVLIFYRGNATALEQSYQIESARRGTELFVRDVREATYGDDGSYPLGAMGTSTVIFFSDTDADGAIERITYSLLSTKLYRHVADPIGTPPVYSGGSTTTVSEHVRNVEDALPVFRYYNASSTEVTNPQFINTVVSVTVQMVVDVVKEHAPGKFTLRESATIRNLRAQ